MRVRSARLLGVIAGRLRRIRAASYSGVAAIFAVLVVLVPTAAARQDALLRLQPGFTATVYARGLTNPTVLAFGPDGALYVAEETGAVVRIPRGSRQPRGFAGGFRTPLGLAWHGRSLIVSQTGGLVRLQVRNGVASGRVSLVRSLPYGLHQQDNVVLRGDGRLYFGSGSTCDACVERDRRSATILSVAPDGRNLRVEASGLRNPYGLAIQPGTGRLYASVNGKDKLGPDEPAEMVVQIRRGARYGWPDCWPSYRRRTLVGKCRGVSHPAAYLEPHSSADGLAFYTGRSFPPSYRGNLFVAEWGQGGQRHTRGRRLVRISLHPDGTAAGISTFADGFDHPLAVVVDPLGALLVADYGRGVIYRIQAAGHR